MSKYNVGLKTLLLQGLSELNFMVTWCINLEKNSKYDFPFHFKKISFRYKKIGYNIDVLRQISCLCVNLIKADNFAYLFDCTTVGRTSE